MRSWETWAARVPALELRRLGERPFHLLGRVCRGQETFGLHTRRVRGLVDPEGARRTLPRRGYAPRPVRRPLSRGRDQLVLLQASPTDDLRPMGRVRA